MKDTPGSEAELELECLSNSSPTPGVCVSRNNKAVVQQGFRRVQSVRLHCWATICLPTELRTELNILRDLSPSLLEKKKHENFR